MTNKQKMKPAHRVKLADKQHTIAKHHRAGYHNRILVKMGLKTPKILKREAYTAKIQEQIRLHKEKLDGLKQN